MDIKTFKELFRQCCYTSKINHVKLIIISTPTPIAFGVKIFEKPFLLISETMVKKYSPKEMKAIIYHEIGHITQDPPFFIAILSSLCAMGYLYNHPIVNKNFTDITQFSMMIILIISLAYAKRQSEYHADHFAAKKLDNTSDLISAILKTESKKKDNILQKYLSTHPNPSQRIQNIKNNTQETAELSTIKNIST